MAIWASAAYVLSGLVDYYRYSGDAAAIAHMTYMADALLDRCQTPADHPWPNFLVSVPVKGKPYGKCDPKGMIQLDIVAEVGLGLLRAYQVTGNKRWLEACEHWGDLMAAKRNRALAPLESRLQPAIEQGARKTSRLKAGLQRAERPRGAGTRTPKQRPGKTTR